MRNGHALLIEPIKSITFLFKQSEKTNDVKRIQKTHQL